VEVATRDDVGGIGKDERIVGHRIALDAEHRFHVAQGVEAGTQDLGCAAQRVGVLDAVAARVARDDRTVREQCGEIRRDRLLAGMRTQGVQARVESPRRAEQGFDRHRRRHLCCSHQGADFGRRQHTARRHVLRAVDERQAFLHRETMRREAGAFERRGRRHAHAAVERLAFAEQRQAEMRERREIAARPDRALLGNDRCDIGIEQSHERLDQRRADSRITARDRMRAQHEHGTHHRNRQRIAVAHRVAAHQIDLQAIDFVAGDARAREWTEAGVDAVERSATARRGGERGGCAGQIGARSGIERDARSRSDGADRLAIQVPAVEQDRFGHAGSSPTRWCVPWREAPPS
jgi:hypothetical protein